ncbi:hypothetical protein [Luteibacter aegosomatissinici]|uniref:hypothetical protein n=1 Tax=Luteibacter aegosomatissinici TaxID=2911539 RepID=UPI001FFB0977|nr:hypothetical protein [Luteibacter aegosomatissinici]UPG95393.1 hypothetical protein L2Y97_04580 [Luteibacter aegosomatissinici]
MDAMFTQWDPVLHLDTEIEQIRYLLTCLEESKGDPSAARAALNDLARAPLVGPFSWGVRELSEIFPPLEGADEIRVVADIQWSTTPLCECWERPFSKAPSILDGATE